MTRRWHGKAATRVAVAVVGCALGALAAHALTSAGEQSVRVAPAEPGGDLASGGTSMVAPIATATPTALPVELDSATTPVGEPLDHDPGTFTGHMTFETADHRFVVVDPKQPLPQSVTTELTASLEAALGGPTDDHARDQRVVSFLVDAQDATGRSVVLVFPVDGSGWTYAVSKDGGVALLEEGSREESLNAARVWIEKNGGTDEHDLIVAGEGS